jgi:hypothetical protein
LETALTIHVQTGSGVEQISPEKDKTMNSVEGKVKIREQTEPPFRGKLNQMLKDGFANQI